jgi:hypothetical protein
LSRRKRPEGVEFLDDVSPARWLEETLWPWETSSTGSGVSVGGLVPEDYSSYGRIFHPAIERVGREESRFSWSTIAERNGRTTHPQMRYWRIAGMPEPYPRPQWKVRPLEGTLPIDECRVAVDSLRQHTSTPGRCYFCIWEGWGHVNLRLFGEARLKSKFRNYLVFTGPIDAIFSLGEIGYPAFQSPNIWWPEDRAWCVATDVDSDSTYVGGTDECIQALLDNPDLEALPAGIEDRIDPVGDPGELFK